MRGKNRRKYMDSTNINIFVFVAHIYFLFIRRIFHIGIKQKYDIQENARKMCQSSIIDIPLIDFRCMRLFNFLHFTFPSKRKKRDSCIFNSIRKLVSITKYIVCVLCRIMIVDSFLFFIFHFSFFTHL